MSFLVWRNSGPYISESLPSSGKPSNRPGPADFPDGLPSAADVLPCLAIRMIPAARIARWIRKEVRADPVAPVAPVALVAPVVRMARVGLEGLGDLADPGDPEGREAPWEEWITPTYPAILNGRGRL